MTNYVVGVLEESISILYLLNDNPNGLTLAQITDSSGLVKNKVFRILFTLEKHLLVKCDEHGYYLLGSGMIRFSHQVQSQTTLLDASRFVMDQLVVSTGESIFLGAINGLDALCVATRESPQSIRLFAQEGRRAPLHSGGVPKILLAFLPEEERMTILDHFMHNDSVSAEIIGDRASLEKQLDQIYQDGYAVVVDELDIGAHSVAAPIHNDKGDVIAAISIAGPSSRFTQDKIDRYIELILKAAEQISRAMGYNVQQFMEDVPHYESNI